MHRDAKHLFIYAYIVPQRNLLCRNTNTFWSQSPSLKKKKKKAGNCTLDIYMIEEKALWLLQLLVTLIMETE